MRIKYLKKDLKDKKKVENKAVYENKIRMDNCSVISGFDQINI